MDLIQISIILSFLFSIIIGLVVGNKVKNKSLNFTVAGRSMSAGLVAIALVAQSIDGNATLGNTSLSFDFGFWAGASLILGLSISLFLLGKFFAKPLNELKLITLADLFEIKYSQKIGFIAAIIMLFGFGILLAGNIATVGILLKLFFHIKYETSIIICTLVVLIYIIRGGILSDIYADILQMILVCLGIFSTLFVLFIYNGPIDFFASETIMSKFSFNQFFSLADGALINWATIVALGFGNLIAIDFGSRIFAAKSGQDAKRSCYLAAIYTLVLGLPFSLIILYPLYLNLASNPDIPILIVVSQKYLPPFISALLITGIVNAALSTIDGALLSMGNILTRNLIRIRPETTSDNEEIEKTALYFFRISLVPIACAAMIFALLLPSPGALLSIAFDITFCALLVPFLFAFSHKYAHSEAAFYAIVVGGVSRIIFATLTPTFFGLPNPLYLQNSFFPPALDGFGTFLSPILALITYYAIFMNEKSTHRVAVNN